MRKKKLSFVFFPNTYRVLPLFISNVHGYSINIYCRVWVYVDSTQLDQVIYVIYPTLHYFPASLPKLGLCCILQTRFPPNAPRRELGEPTMKVFDFHIHRLIGPTCPRALASSLSQLSSRLFQPIHSPAQHAVHYQNGKHDADPLALVPDTVAV